MVDNNKNNSASNIHRALIFQGGGSLGAYEAGAYKSIYEYVIMRMQEENVINEPPFHIVAGTSIGAINSAILVSYVKENKTWAGSAERIIEFWKYVSTNSYTDRMQPTFSYCWDFWHGVSPSIATGESARRYYSTKEYILNGVPNVFRPKRPIPDLRFFDSANTWYTFDNMPLKESLEKFAKFPIATSFEKNEPRLLLVAVDVQEGSPVVFDSYEKENGIRKSGYGRFGKVKPLVNSPDYQVDQRDHEYVIRYDEGITSDFVLASCSVPINYDFTRLEVEDHILEEKGSEKQQQESVPMNAYYPKHIGNEPRKSNIRYFWDGGISANTPLREAILSHRRYWANVRNVDNIPGLKIAIVNLHPHKQDYLPPDYDGLMDRKNDIAYHDRTRFDEYVAVVMADLQVLSRSLIKMVENNSQYKEQIQEILHKKCKSFRLENEESMTYGDLIDHIVDVDYVIRFERKNDFDTIYNKTFDFSKTTIDRLIDDGYKECSEQLASTLSRTK
ncbi:MAG TPA: patatin-like phospholipase family protein [Nitrososphaeraceae archaeon]|jgi:predicted acylesterase/phospholipase RssA